MHHSEWYERQQDRRQPKSEIRAIDVTAIGEHRRPVRPASRLWAALLPFGAAARSPVRGDRIGAPGSAPPYPKGIGPFIAPRTRIRHLLLQSIPGHLGKILLPLLINCVKPLADSRARSELFRRQQTHPSISNRALTRIITTSRFPVERCVHLPPIGDRSELCAIHKLGGSMPTFVRNGDDPPIPR